MTESDAAPALFASDHFRRPAGIEPAWLQTDYGKLRYVTSAVPEQAKGTFVVAHGMSECIEKHYEVLGHLLERGYAVAMCDWRGHGLSAGFPDEVDCMRMFDLDLHQFLTEVVGPRLPAPYFGLAHSMGGCLLACRARRERDSFAALVLCAPMLGVKAFANPFVRLFARVTARLPASWHPRSGSVKDRNNVTTDEQRFYQYQTLLGKHPELRSDFDMARWSVSALQRLRIMHEDSWYAHLDIPTLILLASNEQLVANDRALAAAEQMPAARAHVYEGAMHELFRETDLVQSQVWDHIDSFLAEIPAPAG